MNASLSFTLQIAEDQSVTAIAAEAFGFEEYGMTNAPVPEGGVRLPDEALSTLENIPAVGKLIQALRAEAPAGQVAVIRTVVSLAVDFEPAN